MRKRDFFLFPLFCTAGGRRRSAVQYDFIGNCTKCTNNLNFPKYFRHDLALWHYYKIPKTQIRFFGVLKKIRLQVKLILDCIYIWFYRKLLYKIQWINWFSLDICIKCMYTKSLVNTNSFYTNFTNTHFQKVLILHLTRTMKQKFLH